MSLISWAKTALSFLTMSTSTGRRAGVGRAVAADGGTVAGVADSPADGDAEAEGGTSDGLASGSTSGSSDEPGSVTRTVAGADRSGTGPARSRSTLATARSQRWPAPSVSVATTALAVAPRMTITTRIKAALRQRR